jgi:glyoxylase I family protein
MASAPSLGGVRTTFAHVSVTVSDLDKAKAFYGGVLGLPEAERPDFGFPGAWFSLGANLQLHIIVNPQFERPAGQRERFDVRDPHFAMAVDDADAAERALKATGVRVDEFVGSPTGLRQLFVKDPDGNMVEVIGPARARA